jgi:hydroxymethylpyrimidine/phosphomethylpyrimidine kinase
VALPQIDSTLVLVVAGVDPGGGAGLLRDLATVRALGARAQGIETAGTLQGAAVHRVDPRAPDSVRRALAEAVATLRPGAVKIGMAVGPATAAALVEGLGDYPGPVVVDPVLATSRGGALWAGEPGDLLPLLRRATVTTPNAREAAALAGLAVTTPEEAARAGRRLVDRDGLRAVLVKGGHLAGSDGPVVDLLVTGTGVERFPRARVVGPMPRGTGCALASAVAVLLARGHTLGEAVRAAGDWLAPRLAAPVPVGDEWHLPDGDRAR